MASPLRLTVCRRGDESRGWEADAAWAAVTTEFETAEAELSRFRPTSDLTRLNLAAGSGRAVDVPRRLERALVAADRAHRATGGRFDPRVLRDLDRLGYAGAPIGPDRSATDAERTAGTRVVERVGRGRVATSSPVDLGGIGKGLTLRWAAAHLDRRGVAGTCWRPVATWSPVVPDPTATPGSSGSRTPPVDPTRWPRSRSGPGHSRPRRFDSARGSMTDGPSTTCSTHGPANPSSPDYGP